MKTPLQLMKAFKKANKERREAMAHMAGFDSVVDYADYLAHKANKYERRLPKIKAKAEYNLTKRLGTAKYVDLRQKAISTLLTDVNKSKFNVGSLRMGLLK